MRGTLLLIPTPIAPECSDATRLAFDPDILAPIRFFVVEEARASRRFLRKVFPVFPIDECNFSILNEHTPQHEIPEMLQPLLNGMNVALMSEAGLPCVADPGWQLVSLAHQAGIRVKPLPGPSSIMLALMASGFSGQQFVFHGYLPVIPDQRAKTLLNLEKDALIRNYTQIFIETPYRNQHMLTSLIRVLNPATQLTVALGLMSEMESVVSKPVSEWKRDSITLPKIPAVFLISR